MRLKIDGKYVEVTLSRRNLQTLLNKLDDPTSFRTLLKREDAGILTVVAEDDALHYDNRPEGGPGAVHPAHDPDRRP